MWRRLPAARNDGALIHFSIARDSAHVRLEAALPAGAIRDSTRLNRGNAPLNDAKLEPITIGSTLSVDRSSEYRAPASFRGQVFPRRGFANASRLALPFAQR